MGSLTSIGKSHEAIVLPGGNDPLLCFVKNFPFALFNGVELNPSLNVKVVMASLVNFQSNYGMPFVM